MSNSLNKKTKKQHASSLMLLLLVLIMLFVVSTSYSADRPKSMLTNFIATITQSGSVISEGGTLTSAEPLRVDISFGIPVVGDEPTPTDYISHGDTVIFELSNAFRVLTSTRIEMKQGLTVVGHATFQTNLVTNMVTAFVEFDGDPTVFALGSSGVTCQFGANFEYLGAGPDGNAGNHNVTILEKTYVVNVPAAPIVYNVTKTGTPNLTGQSITWAVTMTATQAGTNTNLGGYQFFDNLLNVGDYISGSFMVSGSAVTPDTSGSSISYVFPAGSTSPKTITFKTKISDATYHTTTEQAISNTAQLLSSASTMLKEGSRTVRFTPQWIRKTGVSSDASNTGIYNPTNRTITWTITANQMGAPLNGVIITDVLPLLPRELTFDSASWRAWEGATWGSITSITPTAITSEYVIGNNITSMIELTIVTKVPDDLYTTETETYSNLATIKWDGLPNPLPGSGNAVVGYNPISKSGVANISKQAIRWKVDVDTRTQDITELKVYDLLVYGNTINLSTITASGIGIDLTKLTPQFAQRYIDGTFSVSTGSGFCTIIPIMQGVTRVADLLEITGLTTSVINTFYFDSQVLNPNIFAGNRNDASVLNTAILFKDTTRLNVATSTVNYTTNMLLKEMLKREVIPNPAAGVNSSRASTSEGFDYTSKSAIFRLSVNADGIDLTNTTNASFQMLGTATLTDTLPTGWEFEDISLGSKYLIFEGYKGTGTPATVVATGAALSSVVGLTTNFNATTAAFTFTTLDKPYVILVKAKLTDETAKQYFATNQYAANDRNSVNLKTTNWTPGITGNQDVNIIRQILGKTAVLSTIPTTGELRWTIDYKRYGIQKTGEYVEDKLPIGIDLRLDSNGKLLLVGNNIAVNEIILNANGSYTTGASVTLVLDPPNANISYDNATRKLSFIIPDGSKSYRFSYLTDITGTPGNVTNTVSLYGGGANQEGTNRIYAISAQDGSASFLRKGWIEIKKTNASTTPLSGAGFKLYAMDGTTIIKEGLTNSAGVLYLKVIPDGEYILKETAAPAGYTLNNVSYSVVVKTNPITLEVTSSIDGKSGADGNKITIKNFPIGNAGNLTIRKTVAGAGANTTKPFNLTLTLTGAPGNYTFIGNGIPGGTITSGNTIALAHNQSITIIGLPKNATYTVTETDYSEDGYTLSSFGTVGMIVEDTTQIASFTNTRRVGNLTISKTVAGNAGDNTKPFEFTLTLSGAAVTLYNYTGINISGGAIKSGDTISLTHGQSISIAGLPKDATYSVVEKNYSADGYTTISADATGTIVEDVTQIAAFTNTRSVGTTVYAKISIIKKDTDGKRLAGAIFTLYGKSGNKMMTAISDANGVASFDNILKDTGYTVKETKAPEGFELSKEIISVNVNTSDAQTFTMINKKQAATLGKILILKKDNNANALGGAEFTLYDSDNKAIATAVTKVDGTAEFNDLPIGTYTVAETRAPLGYVGSDKRATATITTGATVVINFTNSRSTTPPTVGRFEIIKVDQEYRPLSGAQFTLYDKDGKEIAKVVTGNDGLAVFQGLQIGKYSVKETKAPTGHVLQPKPLNFEIKATKTTLSYTMTNSTQEEDVDGTWEKNNEGVLGDIILPKTSGESTTLFTLLVGMCSILAGLILL